MVGALRWVGERGTALDYWSRACRRQLTISSRGELEGSTGPIIRAVQTERVSMMGWIFYILGRLMILSAKENDTVRVTSGSTVSFQNPSTFIQGTEAGHAKPDTYFDFCVSSDNKFGENKAIDGAHLQIRLPSLRGGGVCHAGRMVDDWAPSLGGSNKTGHICRIDQQKNHLVTVASSPGATGGLTESLKDRQQQLG
ncbi:uncharacterized protein AKAME5_002357200 [Lates japonicus]|uniref:Uncharacterized protein n=1 Tax=Lates japonicus TaxID=270547 RepID=A0AAD3NGT4_LATJO|nr:uncharacterized protein AKAME5_002357200 [Lates japonicus]